MTRDDLLALYISESPVAVMVRATLENTFAPERLDELFAQTAVRQRCGELLFSSVVDLMRLVVCRIQPSIHAAYQRNKAKVGVAVQSVYNKLDGIEPEVSAELVRHTARHLEPTLDALGGTRWEPLPGYEVRILDGNHHPGTQHRLRELRTTRAGALPGQTLAVLDPRRKLIVDAFPCEDGHAQERSLLPKVLPRVEPDQVWIADRNFCTTMFLFGIARQKAFFVIRQHGSTLSWETVGKRRKIGRIESGVVYEQAVRLTNPKDGSSMLVRRITVRLDEPTRDGDTEIHILTNLPKRIGAKRIARAYRRRWNIETAFGELATVLHSEVETLGYPKAALFAFCIALVSYNMLRVVRAALAAIHGEARIEEEVSAYYLANELAVHWGGMMIVLPPSYWTRRFAHLRAKQLAAFLREAAQSADLSKYWKHPRGPKRPPPKRRSGKKQKHVSTARILAKRAKTPIC
jgi:IS4 transposase